MTVARFERTLDQELAALLRGASLECLTCGEFVMHARGGGIFCPECGARVFTRSTRLPDAVFVKCGTLDDTSRLRPVVHFWTSSAQPWVAIPTGDLAVPADAVDPAAVAEQWQRLGCRLLDPA